MKYITPTIETDRLILKRGTYEDFCKVYEYDLTRLRNIDGEFEYVKYDPEKLKGFETGADGENIIDFIIFLKDSNKPIGNITFDRYRSDYNSLEISYNTHPDYWNNGYTREATINAMAYIFSYLDIDNIFCSYAEENFKSCNFAIKIGFGYHSTYYEHYFRLGKDIKFIETIISKNDFMTKYLGNLGINYKILECKEKKL